VSALSLPPSARSRLSSRIVSGDATPVEVLHFVLGADAEPTLAGIASAARSHARILSELIDLGGSEVAIGEAAALLERLTTVLAVEVAKLELELEPPAEEPEAAKEVAP